MTDNIREKLLDLIIEAKKADTEDAPFSEFLADFLVANNVTVQKEGYWVEENGVQVCSNCGEEHSWEEYRASFCEDCGARRLPTPPKGE